MIRTKATQKGYNLIELLIAMAMLGTVLLAVISLFFFGRSNVYSGKQMTSAITIANEVLEDLQALTVAQLESSLNFELDGGTPTPLVTNTVNGVSYTNSILRSTDDITADSSPPDFLDTWSAMIQGATTSWAATTAFGVGAVVAPDTPNGFLYKVSTQGVSGGGEPSWPTTVGNTVTDGTVVWTTINPGAERLNNAAVDLVITPDLAARVIKLRAIVSYQQHGIGAASFGSTRRTVIVESVKIRH